MVPWLIEPALVNALLATLLAAAAVLIGRAVRRPAVTHALWVLVLVKLATPPLVEAPVGVQAPGLAKVMESASAGSVEEPNRRETASAALERAATAEFAREAAPSGDPSSEQNPGEAASAPQAPAVVIRLSPAAPASHSLSRENLVELSHGDQQPSAAFVWLPAVLWVLTVVWWGGAGVWFAVQGVRILRFRRQVARGSPAAPQVQQQTRKIAAAMGLRRAPEVRVLGGTFSPLLWAIGLRAAIVFPRELLDRLEENSRATLLAHELAHYRRGDHWVRLLEFVVTGFYWWHPVVWWARREIEAAEETCCDAWVVEQLPSAPRCYAEAILDTLDFLAGAGRAAPPAASGLGHAAFLEKRLIQIMRGAAPRSLSRRAKFAMAFLAAVWLPVQPALFGSVSATSVDSSKLLAVSRAKPPAEISPRERSETGSISSVPINTHWLRESETESVPLPVAESWATADSPDGRFTITIRTDQRVILTHAAAQQKTDLSDYRILAVAFSPVEETFVTGGRDGNVRLWSAATGAELLALEGHGGEASSVAFSPDGSLIASGGTDDAVMLWDATTGALLRTLPASSSVSCVRFSSDGRWLAAAAGNWMKAEPGGIAVWETRTWRQTASLACDAPVGAVAFRDDANQLLAGQWSGRVTLWDLDRQTPLKTIDAPKDAISSAAFWAGSRALADLDVDAAPDVFAASVPMAGGVGAPFLNYEQAGVWEPFVNAASRLGETDSP